MFFIGGENMNRDEAIYVFENSFPIEINGEIFDTPSDLDIATYSNELGDFIDSLKEDGFYQEEWNFYE